MTALTWFEGIRWPLEAIACPKCGHENDRFHRTGGRYWCTPCKGYFSVRTGTVMEKSRLELEVWRRAIELVARKKPARICMPEYDGHPPGIALSSQFATDCNISKQTADRVLFALWALATVDWSKINRRKLFKVNPGKPGPATRHYVPALYNLTPGNLAAMLFGWRCGGG